MCLKTNDIDQPTHSQNPAIGMPGSCQPPAKNLPKPAKNLPATCHRAARKTPASWGRPHPHTIDAKPMAR